MSHFSSPPTDICVVRLSAIGDTCHALAVVRNLQDNWPDSRITWIIGKTESLLMADIPDVEFIIFDKSKGRAAYAELGKRLKARSFDVALCMHASWRVNGVIRRVPAKIKVGFDWQRARDFQWLFTNRRIPAVANEHVLDGMMGFARYIDAGPSPLRWDIPVSDADRAFAAGHCKFPTLVISPCSSQRARNFRNWPADSFAAAARHAQDEHGCRIVLTGGSSELEREYGEQIVATAGGNIVNLIGKTTLKQSLAVFAAADALLCPDSGPAHMATTVSTPVIGLYASSNPDRSGPYVSRRLTVNRYPEAVERFLGKAVDSIRWGRRVRDPDAMDLITIDDVRGKIDDVFGQNR